MQGARLAAKIRLKLGTQVMGELVAKVLGRFLRRRIPRVIPVDFERGQNLVRELVWRGGRSNDEASVRNTGAG